MFGGTFHGVWAALAAVALSGCSPSAAQLERTSHPGAFSGDAPFRYRALPDAPGSVRDEMARDGVQGLAHDDQQWFVTTTRSIWRFPRQGGFALLGGGVAPLGGRYGHLGDLDVKEGVLYVPVDADRRGGSAGIAALRTDLTPIGFQSFPSVAWCAIDPRAQRLFTSAFDADRIHVMRVEVTAERFALSFERDLVLQRQRGGRTEAFGILPSIQGGVVSRDGWLYLASDHPGVGVLVFDAESGLLLGRIPVNHEPRFGPLTNEEVEGIDLVEEVDEAHSGVAATLHMLLHDEWPRRSYSVKHWQLWSPSALGPSAGAPDGWRWAAPR
jgi:hypothetical protein